MTQHTAVDPENNESSPPEYLSKSMPLPSPSAAMHPHPSASVPAEETLPPVKSLAPAAAAAAPPATAGKSANASACARCGTLFIQYSWLFVATEIEKFRCEMCDGKFCVKCINSKNIGKIQIADGREDVWGHICRSCAEINTRNLHDRLRRESEARARHEKERLALAQHQAAMAQQLAASQQEAAAQRAMAEQRSAELQRQRQREQERTQQQQAAERSAARETLQREELVRRLVAAVSSRQLPNLNAPGPRSA